MPYLALLEADLVSMTRSWVVRIWLGLMVVLALVTILGAPAEGLPASESLANLLATYPLIWSTFVIVVSGGAISSEAGVVADSILSKAVTRYEYILAKMTSRLITVLGLYLVVVLPSAYIIPRYSQDDLTGTGVAWAVLLMGMILVLLTNLSVTFSALFNRTLVAVVVVWLLWYAASAIFTLLEVEYLSPMQIIESLPAVLRGDYAVADQQRILAGFGLPAVVFALVAILYFARKDL